MGSSGLPADRREVPMNGSTLPFDRPIAAGRAILRCSALLTMRFAVPWPLPATRWALAPPFHPCRPGVFSARTRESRRSWAVCSLWHCLSRGRLRQAPSSASPGVTRHRAPSSPDFPPVRARPREGDRSRAGGDAARLSMINPRRLPFRRRVRPCPGRRRRHRNHRPRRRNRPGRTASRIRSR